MSTLALMTTAMGLRVLGVGLFSVVVALGLSALRHRRVMETIDRIVSLANGGHAQEARVLARASGRWARPLVAALGGEKPQARGFSVGLDAVCTAIALLGIAHGAASALAMRLLPAQAGMATDVAALLAGMAVLTPLTLITVAAVVRVGSSARRRVRTAGVEVAVRQLAAATNPSGRVRGKETR